MYFISSGEVGHVHTYDRVSVGEYNKNRGYQGQKSGIDRRVIGSHTNPVSITYDLFGERGEGLCVAVVSISLYQASGTRVTMESPIYLEHLFYMMQYAKLNKHFYSFSSFL